MIVLAIGSAIYLVAMQAAVNVPRAAFSACLKQADAKAKTDKIAPDAYMDFLKAQCADQSAKFKSALVSFDVKNGVSRKQASSDADMQIQDYLQGSEEHYRFVFERTSPKSS